MVIAQVKKDRTAHLARLVRQALRVTRWPTTGLRMAILTNERRVGVDLDIREPDLKVGELTLKMGILESVARLTNPQPATSNTHSAHLPLSDTASHEGCGTPQSGRKTVREYEGMDITPTSCSEPSKSGASFEPDALNENIVTRSTPVAVLRTTSATWSQR